MEPDLDGIPHTRTRTGFLVKVRVEPRSSRVQVVGVVGGILKVKLTQPPVGGAANRQLIQILAEHFQVSKSAVRIVRGETSKNKVVEITRRSG
jgi:uncharacterized protein (TIGR00251 family)